MPNTTCSIDGCVKSVTARGWCPTHYRRWQRNGDPLELKRPPNGTLRAFMEDVISRDPTDDCILWPFAMNGNYPGSIGKTKMQGHRWMLVQVTGANHKNLHAAHSCGVSKCVNPGHLYWATPMQNIGDKKKHGTHTQGAEHHLASLAGKELSTLLDAHNEFVETWMENLDVCKETIIRVLMGERYKK